VGGRGGIRSKISHSGGDFVLDTRKANGLGPGEGGKSAIKRRKKTTEGGRPLVDRWGGKPVFRMCGWGKTRRPRYRNGGGRPPRVHGGSIRRVEGRRQLASRKQKKERSKDGPDCGLTRRSTGHAHSCTLGKKKSRLLRRREGGIGGGGVTNGDFSITGSRTKFRGTGKRGKFQTRLQPWKEMTRGGTWRHLNSAKKGSTSKTNKKRKGEGSCSPWPLRGSAHSVGRESRDAGARAPQERPTSGLCRGKLFGRAVERIAISKN